MWTGVRPLPAPAAPGFRERPCHHPALPWRLPIATLPVVTRACGDRLYSGETAYLDLSSGFGSAWLGHDDPTVAAALRQQIGRHWSPGFLPTDVGDRLRRRLAAWLPDDHEVVAVCSTGTEGVELAIRLAMILTGRDTVAGFRGARHGKTLMTRELGRVDAGIGRLDGVDCLPGPADGGEAAMLDGLHGRLAADPPAAVFVEPIHMSGGGHVLTAQGFRELGDRCRAAGALVVADELLTCAFRSGPRFRYEAAGVHPDILVAGKAMAGGFPAALVSARTPLAACCRRAGCRSTFTDHPLAMAAMDAALTRLGEPWVPGRVAEIEGIIREAAGDRGIRGAGAMWCVECRDAGHAHGVFNHLLEHRVVTSFHDRYLRLLPGLVVDDAALRDALGMLFRALERF